MSIVPKYSYFAPKYPRKYMAFLYILSNIHKSILACASAASSMALFL
jgi:hypothetical protein